MKGGAFEIRYLSNGVWGPLPPAGSRGRAPRLAFLLSLLALPAWAQSEQTHTAHLHAAGGNIASYVRWNHQCQPAGTVTITILTPPSHGTVDIRPITKLMENEPRSGSIDCRGQTLPGVGVHYTPAPGFTGVDTFDYRVDYGGRAVRDTGVVHID